MNIVLCNVIRAANQPDVIGQAFWPVKHILQMEATKDLISRHLRRGRIRPFDSQELIMLWPQATTKYGRPLAAKVTLAVPKGQPHDIQLAHKTSMSVIAGPKSQ